MAFETIVSKNEIACHVLLWKIISKKNTFYCLGYNIFSFKERTFFKTGLKYNRSFSMKYSCDSKDKRRKQYKWKHPVNNVKVPLSYRQSHIRSTGKGKICKSVLEMLIHTINSYNVSTVEHNQIKWQVSVKTCHSQFKFVCR